MNIIVQSAEQIQSDDAQFENEVPPKPIALQVIPENIPDELKDKRRWVIWAYEKKVSEWTKVPYDPNSFEDRSVPLSQRRASSTCPETWSSFDHVLQLSTKNAKHLDGIGFMLGEGIVGIDVDKCFDQEGNPDKRATAFLRFLSTYTERSVSGRGLRMFAKGKLPGDKGRKNKTCEVYSLARFFTVTGHRIPGHPATVNFQQKRIDALLLKVFKTDPQNTTKKKATVDGITLEDEAILQLARNARNSDKFKRLWGGQDEDIITLGYTKADGGPDWSNADQALCSLLAFYTSDFDQIDRLFTASGLYRDKWDRQDYKARTINKALECRDQGEVYKGGERIKMKMMEDEADKVCYEAPEADKTCSENPSEAPGSGACEGDEEQVRDEMEDGMSEDKLQTGKKTITRKLVELVKEGADLWRNQTGEVWATLKVENHHENYPAHSTSFRRWLTGRYWKRYGDAANEKAVKGAIEVVDHLGQSSPEHKVYLRYGRLSDRLYVDLGGTSWNAVEVTPNGWRVVENPPVKFRRTKNSGAMSIPVRGGSVDLLRRVLPLSDDAWCLVQGFILDAMKGVGPYLVMMAHGEQGCGKSTLCRMVRRVIDPLKEAELSPSER